MIEIPNKKLAGYFLKCFNPALVSYQGKHFIFYRHTTRPLQIYTQIAFVELDARFQPASLHCSIDIPRLTNKVVTLDDPRAFVWRDDLWIIHCQGARCLPSRNWSTSIVLTKIDLLGQVIQTHLPNYGNNLNCAVLDAPPALEKNWTPLVIGRDLFLLYEINPLTVIKFQPQDQSWVTICQKSWNSPYPTYLSGGTPLIHWHGSKYIGLYHTYDKNSEQQRLYSMGFYVLDVEHWCIKQISAQPILTAWSDDTKEMRSWEPFRRLKPLVVFPSGIIDCGKDWAVSFGWNDCRSFIQLYDKEAIIKTLKII